MKPTAWLSFCIASILFIATPCAGQSHSFASVFQGSTSSAPGVNDNGRVVFWHDGKLKTSYSGVTTTIADALGDFLYLSPGTPSINNSGTVPFIAEHVTLGPGVFTSTGSGSFTTITAGRPNVNAIRGTSINDGGAVSFIDGVGSVPAVYVGNGVDLTLIADTSGPIASFPAGTDINGDGSVAFDVVLDSSIGGIYVGDGGPLSTIIDTSTPPYVQVGASTLNDNGAVASLALTASPSREILISQAGITTTIASTAGPYDFLSAPFINNAGQLAFVAREDGGGTNGIYLNPESSTDRLIRIGDSLFGSTLTNFAFDGGINNLGQIAFSYTLANGERGVAIATPVPEPGALLIAFPAIVAIQRLRRVVA